MLETDDILSSFVYDLSFGWRLRHIRNKRHVTQKKLGIICGFPEIDADYRIRQYEKNKRHPKDNIIKILASTLDISETMLAMKSTDTQIVLFTSILWADIANLIAIFNPKNEYKLLESDISKIDTQIESNVPGIAPNAEGPLLDWMNELSFQHKLYEQNDISLDEYRNWEYMWDPHR